MISSNKRREKSNAKIKAMRIACFDQLPTIDDSSMVKLKNVDEICKKAIASLISSQVALDIENGDYVKSVVFLS